MADNKTLLPGETPELLEKLSIMEGTTSTQMEQRELNELGLVPVQGESVTVLPDYANGIDADRAIPTSPVSLPDRARLAFGNRAGKLKYLKENYEDAKVRKDGSFAVKQEGFWYDVDPDGLGDRDGWSVTEKLSGTAREAAADILDVVPDIVSIGATTAGAAGGLGVASAGTAMAAAGAANVANTSLGRLIGTYDGDAGEQLIDAGIDAVMMGAGYAVLGAGKYAATAAKNAGLMKKFGIEKILTRPSAADGIEAFQKSAKASPENSWWIRQLTRLGNVSDDSSRLIASDPTVANIVKGAVKAGQASNLDESLIIQNLEKKGFRQAGKAAVDATDEFWGNVGRLGTHFENVAAREGRNFQINTDAIVRPLREELINRGLFVVNKNGTVSLAKHLGQKGGDLDLLYQASKKELEKLVNRVNTKGAGTLSGKKAARWINGLNTDINKALYETGKRGDNLRGLLANLTDDAANIPRVIDLTMRQAPNSVRGAWNAKNSYIAKSINEVERLGKILYQGRGSQRRVSTGSQINNFFQQLRQNAEKFPEAKQLLDHLDTNLYGPANSILRAQGLDTSSKALSGFRASKNTMAASEFVRFWPRSKVGMSAGAGAGGALGFAVGGPVGAVVGSGIGAGVGGALTSPRMQARAARMAARFGQNSPVQALSNSAGAKAAFDLMQKAKVQMYTMGKGREHLLPVALGQAFRVLQQEGQ